MGQLSVSYIRSAAQLLIFIAFGPQITLTIAQNSTSPGGLEFSDISPGGSHGFDGRGYA